MPTILVVDDTAVDRRLVGGLLENAPNVDVCYAQNGNEALFQIGNELPDLVVTDLQMPGLDGLELVTSITEKYPQVPVVLMTAHGSENIAAQALANGAASYVPKNELAESLVETVMHILAMSDTDSRYKSLIRCATRTEFEFNLENDPGVIDPLIDLVQQLISSQEMMEHHDRVRVGVAVEHALLNAMFRGNLEITRGEHPVLNRELINERAAELNRRDRRVYFRFLIVPEMVEFTIRDDGDGFDTQTVPTAGDPDSFRDGSGRGLVLMTTFMDEVEFSDKGNEVHMRKYVNESPGKPR
ncbi:MAG: response regulator [Planctomycetota bacterium]